ncbi:MAG TPA: hypothetical protein VFE45_00035, partial [Coriobacteriia bacterium]|nr:hypothetical protein [Coriobacteriia bacterium]
MQTHLRGRDLITLQEWTKDEIDTLLDVAFMLKRERALGRAHPILRDKVLAMLFFFASTLSRKIGCARPSARSRLSMKATSSSVSISSFVHSCRVI